MNVYTLWENDSFGIATPKNPHIPYSEGLHLIISPKREAPNAWADVNLSAETFRLASQVCESLETKSFAPWFNIQANGNWGLLPGAQPFFHVHIYGRNKTDMWGKPLILPSAPETYQNDPMPEADRIAIAGVLASSLANS